MFQFHLSLILCFHYFVLMCAKTATSFLVELLSVLKETVDRDSTVALHLCLLLFIKESAFVTSCSLLWLAKSSKKIYYCEEFCSEGSKFFPLQGSTSFHLDADSICKGGRN